MAAVPVKMPSRIEEDQRLLVPLDAKLNPPQAGAQCLVIGVNDRGRTAQYGDNPLDPIVAPVVLAPVVMVLNPP